MSENNYLDMRKGKKRKEKKRDDELNESQKGVLDKFVVKKYGYSWNRTWMERGVK